MHHFQWDSRLPWWYQFSSLSDLNYFLFWAWNTNICFIDVKIDFLGVRASPLWSGGLMRVSLAPPSPRRSLVPRPLVVGWGHPLAFPSGERLPRRSRTWVSPASRLQKGCLRPRQKKGARRPVRNSMHACMHAYMLCMHACMHAMHECIVCMHAYYAYDACMHSMHMYLAESCFIQCY